MGSLSPVKILGNVDATERADDRCNGCRHGQSGGNREMTLFDVHFLPEAEDAFIGLNRCKANGIVRFNADIAADDGALRISLHRRDSSL